MLPCCFLNLFTLSLTCLHFTCVMLTIPWVCGLSNTWNCHVLKFLQSGEYNRVSHCGLFALPSYPGKLSTSLYVDWLMQIFCEMPAHTNMLSFHFGCGVLMFPTVIVVLSISPLNSVFGLFWGSDICCIQI